MAGETHSGKAAHTEAISAEQALVARLKAGDGSAFTELVDRHGGRMLAVARRICQDEHEAQDALQDAFIQAYRHIQEFQSNSQLGTWLHRITVNAALMRLRTRKRSRAVDIEPLLPAFEQDGHRKDPQAPWPEQARLANADERQRLFDLMAKLPDDYRLVIVLRDLEGLDTQQAADVLQVNAGVVKTRLHRARQALRTLVEQELVQGQR